MKPIVYFGHHKAASTWVQDILRDVAGLSGLDFHVAWCDAQIGHRLDKFLRLNPRCILSYTNANPDQLDNASGMFVGFHLVRDPRDMVVSAYFSHLRTHATDLWPDLLDYRRRLEQLSLEDGMLQTIQDMAGLVYDGAYTPVLDAMRDWPIGRHREVVELRYEDLVADPDNGFRSVFERMGLLGAVTAGALRGLGYAPASKCKLIDPKALRATLEKHSFRHKAGGRSPGQVNNFSHYRSGKAGDWCNYFTPRIRKAFQRAYPGLLSKYGYEKSNDW